MMTASQREFVTLIAEAWRDTGRGPMLKDLGEELGISKQAVSVRVARLTRKGMLKRVWHVPRSLEVTEMGLEVLSGTAVGNG